MCLCRTEWYLDIAVELLFADETVVQLRQRRIITDSFSLFALFKLSTPSDFVLKLESVVALVRLQLALPQAVSTCSLLLTKAGV